MTENRRSLEIRLDPNTLAKIIDAAVVTSCEIVTFHFNALSGADLSKPAESTEVMYRFRGPELIADQRRAMHKNWILAKAFQDLLRAVRRALEEAHVFTVLLGKVHTIRASVTLSEFLRPFQSKAAGLKFPVLLAAVNEKLNPKLDFADSYRSLQLARNCLEHRGGVITKNDTHGKASFNMSFPRIKLFYIRDGSEVEIAKGDTIEPGDGRESVEILTKIEERKRTLAIGERLIFGLAEFNEIAFACHFLGQQLSSKLPKPLIAKE